MANYYTISQIMALTGLSDSYVRKTLRKHGIKESYKQKREKYYDGESIDQIFGKYYYRMHEPEFSENEDQESNQVVLTRTQYDQLVANLGVLRGKLEELENSRQYWERERQELRERIEKLETLIESYHERMFIQSPSQEEERPSLWRRLFGD